MISYESETRLCIAADIIGQVAVNMGGKNAKIMNELFAIKEQILKLVFKNTPDQPPEYPKPKKPPIVDQEYDRKEAVWFICPTCGRDCIEKTDNFCLHCGQEFDWSGEEE